MRRGYRRSPGGRYPDPGAGTAAALTGILLCAGALLQAWFWLGGVTARAPWQAPSSLLLMHAAVLCSVVVWLSGVAVAVARGRADASARSLGWTVFAPVALYATWAALAYLFMQRGAWFVLSLLMLIWVADIGAYFAGQFAGSAIRRKRVWPGSGHALVVARCGRVRGHPGRDIDHGRPV